MRVSYGLAEYESWLNAVHAGHAFTHGKSLDALAANFSEIQLVNPAGSGVVVLVYSAVLAAVPASTVQLRRADVGVTTDQGAGKNLKLGGAAAAAHLRTAQVAALDGTLISELYAQTAPYPGRFPRWFIELDADEGFLLAPADVNVFLSAHFFWAELPA